jgi:hypothetical protein
MFDRLDLSSIGPLSWPRYSHPVLHDYWAFIYVNSHASLPGRLLLLAQTKGRPL